MIRVLAVAALLGAAGCKQAGEGADVSDETKTGVDTQKGSAGGFTAGLAADLAKMEGGSSDKPSAGSGGESGSAKAGSSDGSAGSGSGSAVAEAGSGSGSAVAGSGSGSGSGSAAAGPGSGSAVAAADEPKAGKTAEPKAGTSDVAIEVEPPRAPVEMTPEMKAIKFSMQPNWVRDVVGAGTLSLDVNVQSRDVKVTFKFNYGYDDPKAPTDREQYKKYLAESKQLNVTVDRQRGAAWYLEGTDSAGRTAFRILVTYGGKRLFCGGSAYKESDLGDIRDQVVIQAKSICETISL